MTNPILVFDTDCVLCSSTVAFVLRYERDEGLRFLGAWSQEGSRLAALHGFSKADLDTTFLVVEDGRALTRSDAAIAVLRHLKAPWQWLALLRIVPKRLRDAVYGAIARRRYRWFGRKRDCLLIPAQHRHRFIGAEASGAA